MKTVRTINLGYETFVVPVSMTEKDLVLFLGTFATLERVQSCHSKDYEKAFSYSAQALSIATGSVTLYNSKELAQEDRDQYDTLKAEQAAQALA
jgi:hypothetical protein